MSESMDFASRCWRLVTSNHHPAIIHDCWLQSSMIDCFQVGAGDWSPAIIQRIKGSNHPKDQTSNHPKVTSNHPKDQKLSILSCLRQG
jgi:hypothetical protein